MSQNQPQIQLHRAHSSPHKRDSGQECSLRRSWASVFHDATDDAVTSNLCGSLRISVPNPSIPYSARSAFDEGEALEDWLPQFDAGAGPNDERYEDLLEPLKAVGLRRVKDITLFTPKEIVEYTNCSIAMAKRVLDRANASMRSRR
jgi:hypothetical protein